MRCSGARSGPPPPTTSPARGPWLCWLSAWGARPEDGGRRGEAEGDDGVGGGFSGALLRGGIATQSSGHGTQELAEQTARRAGLWMRQTWRSGLVGAMPTLRRYSRARVMPMCLGLVGPARRSAIAKGVSLAMKADLLDLRHTRGDGGAGLGILFL